MTEQENASLRKVLKEIVPRILRERGRQLNEEDTKNSLIDPVLEALGWNIRDRDQVHHEFKPTPRDKPVDYALKILCEPKLLIEAKRLGAKLGDYKGIIQMLTYTTAADVEWCVLSDGDEYRFYKAMARGKPEEKEFCRVRLSDANEDDAVNALALLSRSNLTGRLSEIEERWTDHLVKTALCELLRAPDKGLVSLIRRKVHELPRNDIIASLARLNIKIDAKVTRGDSGGNEGGGGGRLTKLLKSGVLKPSQKLFAHYKTTEFEATVLPDGRIEFQGTPYGSLSAAGRAAISTIAGKTLQVDGWLFWRVRQSGGECQTLHALRRSCEKNKA